MGDMDNSNTGKSDAAAEHKRPRRNIPPVPPAPGPAPQPAEKSGAKPAETPAEKADPTRFGDWEKNGRCIDF